MRRLTNGLHGGGNGNGRDNKGRFAKGCRPGPGNPHAAQVSRLRSELLRQTTSERFSDIVSNLLTKAENGDLRAAELVLRYTVGDMPRHVDKLVELGRDGGLSNGFVQAVCELVTRHLDRDGLANFRRELGSILERHYAETGAGDA